MYKNMLCERNWKYKFIAISLCKRLIDFFVKYFKILYEIDFTYFHRVDFEIYYHESLWSKWRIIWFTTFQKIKSYSIKCKPVKWLLQKQ